MKMIGLTSAILIITACSTGRLTADKVPSVIVNTVHQEYPAAANIEWEKNGMVYEAEFQEQKSEITVEVDAAGKILRVKQDIPVNSLPTVLADILSLKFKGYATNDVEKLQRAGQSFYQVELKRKGREGKQIVFEENGTEAMEPYWD